MQGSETTPLRIYCVCGQKMKVSEDMFGKPGKCVACRQKIRIPRPDEIPPNTDVLYLKDHPEFLRKVKGKKTEEPPVEEVEVPPVPELDRKGRVRRGVGPLDVLEPLRILTSLEAKVRRQADAAKALDERKGPSEGGPAADDLNGYRSRIRAAMTDLEEELRQRLMEAAIELAATQEKIAELNLAARVGEISFADYQMQVDRLRRKRDNYERRQINLRGWLTIDDPHRAGGFVDLPFDQIPRGGFRITFPNEIGDSTTLLDWHTEALRQAFVRRAAAERKLAEARRMKPPPGSTDKPMEGAKAEAKAELERAQSQISYSRDRLEQLADDYSNDLQSIDAQLDHTRGRMQVGQITRDEFNRIEESLIRSKTDLTKARSLLVRAINANSADEVPRVRGTFVQRLAHTRPNLRAPGDAWIAWIATALVLGALFLPVIGDLSPIQAVRAHAASASNHHWLMSFPIASALALAVASLLPSGYVRGMTYCGIWVLMCVLSTAFLHEAKYLDNPVAEGLRTGGPLLLRPGIIVYVVGIVVAGIAAAAALAPVRDGRLVLPAATLLTLLGLGGILSDWGGLRAPAPQVSVTQQIVTDVQPPAYDAIVSVRNNGGRLLVITSPATMRNAYELKVERKSSTGSWQDAGVPIAAKIDNAVLTGPAALQSRAPVLPGQYAQFSYRLQPGSYRAVLVQHDRETPAEQEFVLEAIGPEAASTPEPAEETARNEPTGPDTAVPSAPAFGGMLSANLELNGIVASPDRPPRFSIKLTRRDGATQERVVSIGDEVYEGWSVAEFNPDQLTLTLRGGSRVLIVRRGETYLLDPVAESK
ncbi:MAG: hypothetical protein AMXMBFR4_09880 [Candidatus Hydrogenedentota bacterium]